MKRLTAKEDAYTRAVVLNGGDKVKAYEVAGYSMNMNMVKVGIQADKVHNRPSVNLRIAQLQKDADKVAKEKFTISVEQRLRWLNEVREAGIATYIDGSGSQRRESLTAVTGAIKIMNEMLGTDNSENTAESLNITFNVKAPVGDIKITRGE